LVYIVFWSKNLEDVVGERPRQRWEDNIEMDLQEIG
jgi:hypothetical protein